MDQIKPDLEGWVPVRVYKSDGQHLIDWCFLGARAFREPFFDQTITSCLEHPFNLLFRHQTPIDVLVDHCREQPGLKPTGFIFHMSRSGSTLISQMFAALSQNIVISEAPPIDAVLKARFISTSVTEQQTIEWLQAMISALGQPRVGSEQQLFIKFEGWHALLLPVIRKAFPDVPWIFAYRDPIDVLVSQMKLLGQLLPGVLHFNLFGSGAAKVLALPKEQYYALVLAPICQAVLRNHTDGGLLINYTELPDAVCSSISDFFNLGWTDAERTRMTSVTARHSKEYSLFTPDSATKQEKATPGVRQAAKRWLYPIYQELEKVRLAGSAN